MCPKVGALKNLTPELCYSLKCFHLFKYRYCQIDDGTSPILAEGKLELLSKYVSPG